MTAPISIAYKDWKATIDAANKAQERVKKLEAALKIYANKYAWISEYSDSPYKRIFIAAFEITDNTGGDIARKALEE